MEKNERPLSVLCADVTGRALLPQYINRPDALYAVERCEWRIKRTVERHGGCLVDRAGGKVMAYFNDGVDALQSAIELQHRVSDLPPYAGEHLAVQVGICAGHQSKEKPFFTGESTNPAANLSRIADPEHILLSVPKRVKLFPWSELDSDKVPDLALNCGNRQLGVLQVAWQETDPVMLKMALSQIGNEVDQLFLRHNDIEFVLDGKQPGLKIGRQENCEIKLLDTRTSRLHGTIEQRLDRFVFVDRSTNGTFVTLEDQIEFYVHHKELVLFGHGQLSLGAPSSSKGVEVIRFQTSNFP